mmetsp:Transcript_19955/g.14663  ORF Transcript_19955/g.14663 Transcript_19955/m.14663 type:complete len:81 (+) Transcript_19955:205-447(+)
MANAMALIKITKGKGLILSSETSNKIFHRSPMDVVSLCLMLGMKSEDALSSLSLNCENVFKHARMRKMYKGTAELVHLPS